MNFIVNYTKQLESSYKSNDKKSRIYEKVMYYLYLITGLKLIVSMNCDYGTQKLLFDLSIFMNGIQLYNQAMCALVMVHGSYMYYKLHINPGSSSQSWIREIYPITGRIAPRSNMGFNGIYIRREKSFKILIRMKYFWTFMYFKSCKLSR